MTRTPSFPTLSITCAMRFATLVSRRSPLGVDGTENGCRAVSGDFVHLGSGIQDEVHAKVLEPGFGHGNHFRLKGDDSLSTSQLKQRKHSSNRPTTVTDLLHSQNLKLSINRKQVKYRRPSTLKEADYRGWALNKPLSAGARQIWGSIRDYFSAIPPVAQGLDMRLPPPGLPRVAELEDGCTSCTVGGMTSSVLALPLELGAIRVEGWTG
ncbi:hypothetical protein DFP72DRAFT_863227 [Ephemerocybe angulata]|uniref:Uncharacterized protein n=1 Tax=Ephemerocybe angulata TaxID=980116 RepID=A0A8H6LRI9_9AGAR|nr:hypothetical protein DFP72DRAFT_863227 [Tulosesus angulatus]